MRAWLQYGWYRLSASLWFLPVLLMAAAVALSFITLYLDSLFRIPALVSAGRGSFIGQEGSRQLLATIAASMITVASLVFSITVVALQLAASQLGPRVVTRFMEDKVNQVVLGTFLATFLYALLILRAVPEGGETALLPNLSVVVAVVLTMASLIWLVYFIHHLAESIQADTAIAEVSGELHHAIGRMFPAIETAPAKLAPGTMPPLDRSAELPGEVCLKERGYIQAIDSRALLKLATRHDLIMELRCRPGDFVVAGVSAVAIWPSGSLTADVDEDVLESIVIGYRRTPTQDVEFALSLIVQMALRALSPALNDPITAITCVDRLAAAVVEILRRPPLPSHIPDADGVIRLILSPSTFEGALGVAFDDIRQSARGHARVLIRLAEVFTMLVAFAQTEEQCQALEQHAVKLTRTCRDSIQEPLDLVDAEAALKGLSGALARERRVEAASEG
jgi:uncharacterized membrane protein